MALHEEMHVLEEYFIPAPWHMKHIATQQETFQDCLDTMLKAGVSPRLPGLPCFHAGYFTFIDIIFLKLGL